jgi:hypothetical protein
MQTNKENNHATNLQAFGIETEPSNLIKVKEIYGNFKTCGILMELQNKMLLFFITT